MLIEDRADKDNGSIGGSLHAFEKKKKSELRRSPLIGVVALYLCRKTYFNSEVEVQLHFSHMRRSRFYIL